MQLIKANNLACPLDGAPFGPYDKQLRCPNGHCFDEARQGYMHLLPVQHKKSREPGDSKAMIEARSRFLEAGFYAPISEHLNALALSYLPAVPHLCVVDAGCGEGYYLARFAEDLLARGHADSTSIIGLDIAKPAVLAATKRNRLITWLVASNKNPALLPATVDLIFCMFGFPDFPAFQRILRPGGIVILVDAGAEHLLQLREVIYPEVRKAPPPSLEKAQQAGFELLETQTLNYRINASMREHIADLLLMTPHLFRATHAGKQAAAQLQSIDLTVDVVFRVLENRRAEEVQAR